MRVLMTKGPSLAKWWPAGREFVDAQLLDDFKPTLKEWDALCASVGDKWLFNTDQPTMLDVHFAGVWEFVFQVVMSPGAYKFAADHLDVRTNAPHWVAYMERFRCHPLIYPYRFRHVASEKHGYRALGWEKGVKCQLSLTVLEGAFEE